MDGGAGGAAAARALLRREGDRPARRRIRPRRAVPTRDRPGGRRARARGRDRAARVRRGGPRPRHVRDDDGGDLALLPRRGLRAHVPERPRRQLDPPLRDRGAEAALPDAARARRALRRRWRDRGPLRHRRLRHGHAGATRRDGLRDRRRQDVDQLPRRRELLPHVRAPRDRRGDRPEADLRLPDRRRHEGRHRPPPEEQVRLPPAGDRRARARERARPAGGAPRGGGQGLRDRDERRRERPPRGGRARGRAGTGLRRRRDRLRPRAASSSAGRSGSSRWCRRCSRT